MSNMAARSIVWVSRTLLTGSWPARMALLGIVVAALAFGGRVLGPATMHALALVLTLFMLIVAARLVVGGGRR